MRYAMALAAMALLVGTGEGWAQDNVGNPGRAQESAANPHTIKNLERKCGGTQELDDELRGTWHEKPVFTSADDAGVTTLLYTSEQGRTWTLVLRFTSSDRSCVLNYGEHATMGDGGALTN